MLNFFVTQKPLKRVLIEDIGGEPEPPTSSQLPLGAEERQHEKHLMSTLASTIVNSQSDVNTTSNGTMLESKPKAAELEIPLDVSQPSNQNTKESAPVIIELHENDTCTSGVGVPASSSDSDGTRMEVVKETQRDSGSDTALPADVTDQSEQHVMVPSVPDSSLQFQADWKRLRRDKTALTTYFKVCLM